jgi:hypothetical protein
VLFDVEDRPKIADFGIAGLAGALTLTDEGTVLGTAAYISPEQVKAEPATPASDVYSFGAILYRMLTGRLPFEAAHPLELAEEHVRTAAPAIEALRPDAPPDLADVAAAALAKSPKERPADGAALVAAIGTPASATFVTTSLGEAPTQFLRTARRNRPARLLAGATAVLALAAAGIGLALLTTGGPAPASGTQAPDTNRHAIPDREPARRQLPHDAPGDDDRREGDAAKVHHGTDHDHTHDDCNHIGVHHRADDHGAHDHDGHDHDGHDDDDDDGHDHEGHDYDGDDDFAMTRGRVSGSSDAAERRG